ncbi:amino acid ABC transporter substrate-binding protein [Algoriphagus sp. D3-2-R+10]|uniref:amino acid ABC transporter substrate-binding protein n=1 Tax=Algoriphagus aurantiacus TaxID=3103948 RepID=UPI002B38D5D9|nr:amino acid ABC transporter substrate-binding protein [Algoriphagus sp. D3-2-R+10]MEB2777999.1 amino acid ABC transporter substrate-binding protein [Algoriphagus sp. D3-2-R+10]
MKKFLLVIPVFFILSFAFAQIPTPDDYRKAQSELAAKNYWEAIPLFKKFTDPKEYGNLANYAAFHLGEAALGANQPAQAIAALEPVVTGNWAKSDESKYLLAIAYFKNQQNIEALQLIKKIKDKSIMEMAENATYENLKQVSVSFMIANLSEFKENKGYGEALKRVLESQSILSATERAAYYELQGKANESKNVVKDQVLDIVVILPFTSSSRANVSSISQNDFVFELYQGLEYGVEQLKLQGTQVNMLTFDSKRDVAHLQNLLSEPAIASADIIIGPIYPEEADMVSNFAETAKVPFVHPLSNLGDRFEELDYSYLFRPSVSSIANGIVDGLRQQNWGKRVAIGYSISSRDEMLANMLQDQLGRAGFQLIKFQQINPRNTSDFLQGLGIRRGDASMSVDQIILLSDDPAIAQPAFSLMESITASIPTLVMDSWLGFNFANYEMLEFPNFYFIGNNTLNFYGEPMQQFRNKFYDKYLSFPSMNTVLGAELVSWVSSNMSDTKGFDLRRNLNQKAFQAGNLTWGFNFQSTHNNQYVPLFTLEAGELKPLD